jgi:mannose-6-phosphate isomerase|tara:strand:- start:1109 stop:1453 length:345 start_codon:yes stop_codon:yes gene_type:complete
METEERPWGRYEVLLDSDTCKVKRLYVNPGSRPSYQYHHKRSEVWTIVEGTGVVTLDDNDTIVTPGTTIEVPVGVKHRICNTGTEPLVFIEVQYGSYFGEDDIVRLEDDYRRSS